MAKLAILALLIGIPAYASNLRSIQQFQLNLPPEERDPYEVLGIERAPLESLEMRAEDAYTNLSTKWDPLEYVGENSQRALHIQKALEDAFVRITLYAAEETFVPDEGEGWRSFDEEVARHDLEVMRRYTWIRLITSLVVQENRKIYGNPAVDEPTISITDEIPGIENLAVQELEELYVRRLTQREERHQSRIQTSELYFSIQREADSMLTKAREFRNYNAKGILDSDRINDRYKARINGEVIPRVIIALWEQYGEGQKRPQYVAIDEYWHQVDLAFGRIVSQGAWWRNKRYISRRDLLLMAQIAQKLHSEIRDPERRGFVGEISDFVHERMYGTLSPMEAGKMLAVYLTLHPEARADEISQTILEVLGAYQKPDSFFQKIANRVQPFAKTRILEAVCAYLLDLPNAGIDTGILEPRRVLLIEQTIAAAEMVLAPPDFAVFLNHLEVHLKAVPEGDRSPLIQEVGAALAQRMHLMPKPTGCRPAAYGLFSVAPGGIY